jgi:hypothetical protein
MILLTPNNAQTDRMHPIIDKENRSAVGSTARTPKKYRQNVPSIATYDTINLNRNFILYILILMEK